MNIETAQSRYCHLWHKYRPVILRLMIDAKDAPQHYALSNHEFRRIFPKNQSSLAFILYIHRSRAVNNIKTSPLAHALLQVLRDSKTAIKLTERSTFEFLLDEKFIIHVRKSEEAICRDITLPAAVPFNAVEVQEREVG
jgi:hypothetical protein